MQDDIPPIETKLNRPHCLFENPRLQAAIKVLMEELQEDLFLHSLKECMLCHHGQDRSEAINLHCQLKSTIEILGRIHHQIQSLQQSHDCLTGKP